MISGEDIIAEARRHIGTPFHHQGRMPDKGLDCIGLLVVVARALDIPIRDCINYRRYPDGHALINELSDQMDEVTFDECMPGDIGVFWYARPGRPQHVGFLDNDRLIHTYTGSGAVRDHDLDDRWRMRLMHVFRFKGVF